MDYERVTSRALIEIRELKIGTHYIHYYVCSTEKKKIRNVLDILKEVNHEQITS